MIASRGTAIDARIASPVLPSICFVAHTAYAEMAGASGGSFGGAQRQQSMMARALARRGFRVTMLTWDEGQPPTQIIDGVRVLKMCRSEDGWPVLRFLHPRWTSLWRALRAADADVYYHNSAEYVTGQVAHWCRLNRRRFVYSVASDPACDSRLPLMPRWHERVGYRYGIRHADRLVVQTLTQQRMLQSHFKRPSVVLPMPCQGPTGIEYVSRPAPSPGRARVIWVGRIVPLKRIEWLLEAAAALPHLMFEIAGSPERDNAYSRNVVSRGKSLPNVVFHDRLPRERMDTLYRHATCLCCTSEYEGFPNTFLEAWSHGVPVISTVDPDGVIREHDLGLTFHDRASLVQAIESLVKAPERWRRLSVNSRSYYERHHTEATAMQRFEALFIEVAR